MALKDRGVIVPDGCVRGGEGDIAASVTQLSNGEEGVRREVGNDMDFLGSGREARNVKLRLMGRVHDGAVRVANADGIVGRSLVDDWWVGAEEVAGASSVSNGRGEWLGWAYRKVG
jgi:hypothetical protein